VGLEVRAGGNRRLTVDAWGSPTGTPVFLLHGTPGSRNGPRPRSSVLYRLGIRLISYDRPGYGGSDPQGGRTVADAAADVEAIADTLGLYTFGVVGRSGGAPHALACAALIGDRVHRVAGLVSLAPPDAEGLDWFAGMSQDNIDEYEAVRSESKSQLVGKAARIRQDPEEMFRTIDPGLAIRDKRVIEDIAIRSLLTDTYAEALSRGSDGWVDDDIAFRRPWGFDVRKIDVPVLLWHGEADKSSPPGHTLWLGRHIPGSVVVLESDAAHFGAIEILPRVLAWIKGMDSWTAGPDSWTEGPDLFTTAGDPECVLVGAADAASCSAGARRQSDQLAGG
jgi:pimeloyl-ACP methyl ester carboxylesterase